nr:S-layer homology domain-containing protein [uncultured Oscillibacter sp.]
MDGKGKVEWLTKSSYDPDLGTVVFETGHFSIYGIGYKNPAPDFTDIKNHWAEDNIIFVASRGLLSGTGNNQFSPNTGMTRGMFVTALGRLADIDPNSYKTGKFTDVKADAYYAPYVNWAAEKGIVNGTSATTFSPDTNITREQMAVIMANYAKKLGYLDTDTPYLTVRRAWHTEHNRPVILTELKTKAAERNIPLPICLAECLKAAKATSTSDYVVANRDGEPLSYTQFKRLWQYIVTRTVKERCYYRYEDGKRVKHTVTPVLGEKAAHNGKVVYSLDFEVTPHQLRHTYITNLIHSSVDPKTVQYLAGHENSKITMDIYAKVKYNRPDQLVRAMGGAFAQWDAV